MIGMIGPDWLWNHASSYNFVSGPLPDITLITGIALWWRKHNCHVRTCWRLQWHPHPVHGHPVCRRHHPETKGEHLDSSAHPRAKKHTTQKAPASLAAAGPA
jgi:hypothetical protein